MIAKTNPTTGIRKREINNGLYTASKTSLPNTWIITSLNMKKCPISTDIIVREKPVTETLQYLFSILSSFPLMVRFADDYEDHCDNRGCDAGYLCLHFNCYVDRSNDTIPRQYVCGNYFY